MSLLDKVSLCLTANAYKESRLYSFLPSNSVGDMNVVRATTATRVNEDGLIEVVPRNLLTYSNDFSNGIWGKTNATITPNNAISPDGKQNASKLQFNTSAAQLFQEQITAGTITLSIYIKGTSGETVSLGNTLSFGPLVTLNGQWQKFVWTQSSSSLQGLEISNSQGATASIVFIYAFQLELGSVATDYFPTTTRLNIPRLDYYNDNCPSLIIEPERTNLVKNSQVFNIAFWNKDLSTVVDNNTISPDGTINASKLTEVAGTGSHHIHNASGSFTPIIGTSYSMSCFVKLPFSSSIRFVQLPLFIAGFGTNAYVNFDLLNGVVGTIGSAITSYSIKSFENGWFRISATALATATGSSGFQLSFITASNSVRTQSYTVTAGSEKSVFMYGTQLELGSYPSSYIPTLGASTVTRNGDVISKTGIETLIGQTQGTVFLDFNFSNLGTEKFIAHINDATNANSISIKRIETGEIKIFLIATTYTGVQSATSQILPDGDYKIAYTYISGTLKLFINGALSFSLTSTFTFGSPLQNVRLGCDQNNLLQFGDTIKSFELYKTVLSDIECINLTSTQYNL